jgi:hypothetical protein
LGGFGSSSEFTYKGKEEKYFNCSCLNNSICSCLSKASNSKIASLAGKSKAASKPPAVEANFLAILNPV